MPPVLHKSATEMAAQKDWVWVGVSNLGALEAVEVADSSRMYWRYFTLLCFMRFLGVHGY
jgi:hypothetical protein